MSHEPDVYMCVRHYIFVLQSRGSTSVHEDKDDIEDGLNVAAAAGEGTGGREAAKGAEIVDLKSTLLHTLKNVSL